MTSYLSDIFSKTGQYLLTLFINGEVIDCDNVIPYIHKHVKESPGELAEAMNVKLSLDDRFLLEHQDLIEKLTCEIQAYIEKEFP